MARESELLTHPDKPLGRVVLIPPNGVAVVHGKLVVEVVVTFANGDERRCKVIPGSMLVIERRFSKPVGKGIDAESRLNKTLRIDSFMHVEKETVRDGRSTT